MNRNESQDLSCEHSTPSPVEELEYANYQDKPPSVPKDLVESPQSLRESLRTHSPTKPSKVKESHKALDESDNGEPSNVKLLDGPKENIESEA